jgi:hypothetical protein
MADVSIKRMIRETDALALVVGDSLVLDQCTIAAPALLGGALHRGLRTVQPSVSGDRGVGRAKKECLWHLAPENDGTYVFQVIEGQASMSLIGSQGSVALRTDSVQELNP